MARPKGQPKLGGRKKGSLNKTTIAVKEALHQAFEKMGGVKSLIEWGREDPGEFYKLWVKTLPQEIRAELSGAGGKPLAPLVIFKGEDPEPDATV